MTLATLSKNPVLSNFYDSKTGTWENHVALGAWADLFIIAPASANTLAKMAHGICDNLVLATYLSCKSPVIFAPAMDLDMYKHPSTQKNISTLLSYGNTIIEPTEGELASGLIGKGRLEEPTNIILHIEDFFKKKSLFKGKNILITAGPTYEKIDPVRFIGNYSSGKMGFALAEKAAEMGAKVTLVSGPVSIIHKHNNITRIDVENTQQMYQTCVDQFNKADITIMAAAVADYSPVNYAKEKIKKNSTLSIELKKNVDILQYLGQIKTKKQMLVGFALESTNEVEYAKQKIAKKNLDYIILNSLRDKGAGFQYDTNKISIFNKKGIKTDFSLKLKSEVAEDILKCLYAGF